MVLNQYICNVCIYMEGICVIYLRETFDDTARSVEDETRNAELNGSRNPEWWGDFSQLVKIEKI